MKNNDEDGMLVNIKLNKFQRIQGNASSHMLLQNKNIQIEDPLHDFRQAFLENFHVYQT